MELVKQQLIITFKEYFKPWICEKRSSQGWRAYNMMSQILEKALATLEYCLNEKT